MKVSNLSYYNQQPTCNRKLTNKKQISQPNFKAVDIKVGANAVKDLQKADRLFVVAHPDDETCFFGFLIKLLKDYKKEKIQVLYTTSGQNGRDVTERIPRYSPQIRDARLKELQDVMNTIEMREAPVVLDMMDGETHFPHNRAVTLKYIKDAIIKTEPKDVYSFDKTGITGHTDHFTAGNLTEKALRDLGVKNMNYWHVGLTQEGADKMIMDTMPSTNMFRYARPSIITPDKTIDITNEIPVLIESFSRYVTQFTADACKDIKKFFESYPYINLKRVNYKKAE